MASTTGAANYTTYQDRYRDPSNDVFHGNYAGILSIFKMRTGESARATQAIQDKVHSTLDVQPHHYLQLTKSGERYQVTVLHRPTQYSVPMGVESDNDGSTLVFVSDVRSGMSPTIVFWPDSAFTPSGIVNVPRS